jgi:hypothetical protein
MLGGAVAFGVVMGCCLANEIGLGGAIMAGALAAIVGFFMITLRDFRYFNLFAPEGQRFSLWEGNVETFDITDDVPKFVACAGCGHPVRLSDDLSEDAKTRAHDRLHVED